MVFAAFADDAKISIMLRIRIGNDFISSSGILTPSRFQEARISIFIRRYFTLTLFSTPYNVSSGCLTTARTS